MVGGGQAALAGRQGGAGGLRLRPAAGQALFHHQAEFFRPFGVGAPGQKREKCREQGGEGGEGEEHQRLGDDLIGHGLPLRSFYREVGYGCLHVF